MTNRFKLAIGLLFIASQLFGDIKSVDIDGFLKELKPAPTVNLCKKNAQTLNSYVKCVETKAKKDPTVENINFLAGIYAVNREYDKAIKTYEINVAKGDKKATYYLAGIYNEALQQHDKALPYFEKIKEYKDSTCQIGGIMDVTKNETSSESTNRELAKKRTFDFYEKEIKAGNVKAYGCEGLYYNKFEEYDKAEKVFLEGLKKGDKQNLFYLGNLYDVYLVKIPEAIKYYEKSYDAGNDQAAHNLGYMYETRWKYDEAVKWYMLSAKRGDLKSLYQMGNIYRVNKEEATALKIYKAVGDLGLESGYKAVWVYYTKAKKYDNAVKYLKGCYKTGHKECARYLGRIYADNLKEYDKAKEWQIKGYEMGDAESAFDLGNVYREILKDYPQSIEWYKKASDMGYLDATYNVGAVYKYYLHDKNKAIKWLKKVYKLNKDTSSILYIKTTRELKDLGAL